MVTQTRCVTVMVLEVPQGSVTQFTMGTTWQATVTVPREEVMTTKVGEQEVRIGKTDYIMKSETVEFQNGTVIDVEWGD